MLRPSRHALLPHHRFRAGTVQTLQAAQGQARGRGQAWGLWDCASKPEVTSDSMSDTDSHTDSETGHVPTAVESIAESDFENMKQNIEQLKEEMSNISTLAINNAASIGVIENNNSKKTPDEHRDTYPLSKKNPRLGGMKNATNPDNYKRKPEWIIPGDGNADDTGDDNKAAAAAAPFALRKSGYGDLRV